MSFVVTRRLCRVNQCYSAARKNKAITGWFCCWSRLSVQRQIGEKEHKNIPISHRDKAYFLNVPSSGDRKEIS